MVPATNAMRPSAPIATALAVSSAAPPNWKVQIFSPVPDAWTRTLAVACFVASTVLVAATVVVPTPMPVSVPDASIVATVGSSVAHATVVAAPAWTTTVADSARVPPTSVTRSPPSIATESTAGVVRVHAARPDATNTANATRAPKRRAPSTMTASKTAPFGRGPAGARLVPGCAHDNDRRGPVASTNGTASTRPAPVLASGSS